MARQFSVRIPVHGFVPFSEWERDIINHPVFQRLRRIRQLAFSEHIYPGSTHTRFEHSLGVMHIATRLFDAISNRFIHVLEDRFNYDQDKLRRARQLVRLSALLHDVGHAPFSHTSEDLMPLGSGNSRIRHEAYSEELIACEMTDVIDGHKENLAALGITGREVANFYAGRSANEHLIWRDIVDGQLDADRMDYLLRDSHHAGVKYGVFDLDRIIDTIVLAEHSRDDGSNGLQIAVERGGIPAAEGLILARYYMFVNVYFHKARIAYDYHAAECTRAAIPGGVLPSPLTATGRRGFLKLDDGYVMNKSGLAKSRHLIALRNHHHDKCVYETVLVPDAGQIDRFEGMKERLAAVEGAWTRSARQVWYKIGAREIHTSEDGTGTMGSAVPLSQRSKIVQSIEEVSQMRCYVPRDKAKDAAAIIREDDNG